MTRRTDKHGFAFRPGDPDRWIKSAAESARRGVGSGFTARLAIDVAPELRGCTKVAAFQRGTTVADMLRELLAREFPADNGGAR